MLAGPQVIANEFTSKVNFCAMKSARTDLRVPECGNAYRSSDRVNPWYSFSWAGYVRNRPTLKNVAHCGNLRLLLW